MKNKILKTIYINKCKKVTFIYFFLLLAIFNTNLLATNSTNINNNISNYSQQVQKQTNKSKQEQAHEIYVKYKTFPKTIYLNQRFEFKLEVLILNKDHNYNDFNLSYVGGVGVKIFDEQNLWVNKDNHTYTKTLIAKAINENFKFPTIRLHAVYTNLSIKYVSIFENYNNDKFHLSYKNVLKKSSNFKYFLNDDGDYSTIVNNSNINKKNTNTSRVINSINITINLQNNYTKQLELVATLPPKKIKFVKISKNKENFSQIVANSFKILEVQTTQYNNKNYKVSLSIQGNGSNLEDLNFANLDIFQKQVYFEENNTHQYLDYEILVPISLNMLNFNYYSLVDNKFKTIKIPIVLQQDLLSTQHGISPHVSSNISYEKVLMAIGVLICFVIFYFTRHIIFLLFGIFLLFIFVFSFLRIFLNEIELKKGTTIFVLPTTNSYIYKKIQNVTKVKIVLKKSRWSKVLLENDKIGWIKNEHID
jgi:hypothetical protein